MLHDPAGFGYVAVASLFACLAVVTWRRRANSAVVSISLAVVMLSGSMWATALAVATLAQSRTLAAAATLATLPGPGVMGAALVCLGFAVARPQWIPSRRVVLSLLVVPAVITVAGLAQPLQGWLYRGPGAAQVSGAAGWTGGLDGWWGYAGAAVGIGLIASGWWNAPPVFRAQRLALLLAALAPAAGHRAFLAGGFGPVEDPTVFGFAVTGAVLAYAFFRHDPALFAPVARTLIVDQIGDAILAISPAGRILDLNPAAGAILRGMNPTAPAELIGSTDLAVFGRRLVGNALRTELSLELPGGRVEFQVRATRLVDRRRRALGTVYVARDVTAANAQSRHLSDANSQLVLQVETIERLRADLVQLASRDPLTGLHNRRHLVDRFGPMIAAAQRSGVPVAVVLLDVDQFKSINDEYGHLAGDKVLVAVAQRLREQAPASALVARWGGEEFFVALPGADAATGIAFANEARHRCEQQGIAFAGHTIHCTLSGGVASYPLAGATVTELFHAADVAMYTAKSAGRNVIRLHQSEAPARGPGRER